MMKVLKKIIVFSAVLFSVINAFSQKNNIELEQEILNLKSSDQIQSYWNKIHKDDQSVRGKVTKEQEVIDRQNFKKVLLMIKYHGYPVGFCHGCNKSTTNKNFTPNIVVVHNEVPSAKELILPLLRKAYKDSLVNEFWYLHNLRGMVRARYGRDFYDKTIQNEVLFYEKIKPFIKSELSYDLVTLDSIFSKYDEDLNQILSSKLIFAKKHKGIKHNIYKNSSNEYFWQKVYSDGSFNFPQKIYFNEISQSFHYSLLDEEIKEEIIIKNEDKIINFK